MEDAPPWVVSCGWDWATACNLFTWRLQSRVGKRYTDNHEFPKRITQVNGVRDPEETQNLAWRKAVCVPRRGKAQDKPRITSRRWREQRCDGHSQRRQGRSRSVWGPEKIMGCWSIMWGRSKGEVRDEEGRLLRGQWGTAWMPS